jgi:enoyl-[acyl-carrier protein] reductase III
VNPSFSYSKNEWALILGASSGFGAATARELARHGMNIIGVHFDRAAALAAVEELKTELEGHGVKVRFFNVNASDPAKITEVLDAVKKEFASDASNTFRVLMHSLAFGSLKPLVAKDPAACLTKAQIEMTLDVMANTLIYWTQGVVQRDMMKSGGRIFAMTSSGGRACLMNYGAVSAAKAALESYIRQLSLELGPMGITANAILAGVTNTPALQKIPGAKKMLDVARAKNPSLRNGIPEDVAKAIALLAHDNAYFISGNTLCVDGGEDVVEYIGQIDATRLE